jgi:hypothetical protein
LQIFGLKSLGILFKHLWTDAQDREIDSRWNYLGLGCAITLCFLFGKVWEFTIVMLVFSLLNPLWGRIWADGDIETMRWIVGGLVLFNSLAPLVFLGLLLAICLIERVFNKFFAKKSFEGKLTAGIPHILVALTCFYVLFLLNA